MEIINKYFPQLSEEQQRQFARLKPLYEEWNAKINVNPIPFINSIYKTIV